MKIQVVGHRGASGYAPETTIASYRMAIQMGADYVETDVHRSRDGVLVAIHDAEVSRTTNGKGFVADHTLAELKALDAGSWFNNAFPEKARPDYIGLRVPALQEVMDVVQESSAGLFIEIKDPERYQQPAQPGICLAVSQSAAVLWRTEYEFFLSARTLSARSKNWMHRFQQYSWSPNQMKIQCRPR